MTPPSRLCTLVLYPIERRPMTTMAERVDDFPDQAGPYDEWLDGSVWKLEEGVDYKRRDTLRSALSQTARRRGGRTKTKYVDGHLYVQFIADGEPTT